MLEGIGNSYRIVPLAKEHVEEAVEMHLLAFRNFFLTFLGQRFLREAYGTAAGHEQTVGYVALNQEDEVVGVCFGFVNAKAFYKDILKRRWWAFAFHSIWGIIRRPTIIPRIFRVLKYEGNPPPCNIKPLGALPNTAVKPNDQGMGIAIALIRSACDEFVRRGVHAVYLHTDADNNDRVRGFYSALGWDFLAYYTTPEGRKMCWYLWQDPATKKPIEEVMKEEV
jgi:ribosomal protein S18 acetylase RimI-like enzyme